MSSEGKKRKVTDDGNEKSEKKTKFEKELGTVEVCDNVDLFIVYKDKKFGVNRATMQAFSKNPMFGNDMAEGPDSELKIATDIGPTAALESFLRCWHHPFDEKPPNAWRWFLMGDYFQNDQMMKLGLQEAQKYKAALVSPGQPQVTKEFLSAIGWTADKTLPLTTDKPTEIRKTMFDTLVNTTAGTFLANMTRRDKACISEEALPDDWSPRFWKAVVARMLHVAFFEGLKQV